jgi:DNA replication protein DnaC
LRPYARGRVLAYRRDITQRIAAGRGLWLWGPGTTKAPALALIARQALDTGHLVAFTSTLKVLAELKDPRAANAGRPSPIATLSAPDLLVLQDLDLGRQEDWALPRLANELRRRAGREIRAMLITSDCNPSELGPVWGWRTIQAIKYVCGPPINVDPSYTPPPPDRAVVRAGRRAKRARVGG